MERTEAKRSMEFDLYVSDDLPLDGSHCVGRVHEGRGTIVHSRDATEADLAELRAMLTAGEQH